MCFFFFIFICFCVFSTSGAEVGRNVYGCACVSARPGRRPQGWWDATLRSPGGDATQLNGPTFGRFCSSHSLSASPAAETAQECRAAAALAFRVGKV